MNTTLTHGYDLSGLTTSRSALHGLPVPLNDEDGGGECHPSDENEIGP